MKIFEEYTVTADKKPDLKFRGELIAKCETSPNCTFSNYSNDTGRWQILALYKTETNKFVCNRINCSSWVGEKDFSAAEVCETLEDVKKFFGQSFLAKELYEKSSIDNFIEI